MKFLLTCFYTFHCRGFYQIATENPQITKEISILAKHSFIFYNSPGVAAFLSNRRERHRGERYDGKAGNEKSENHSVQSAEV